MAYEWKNKVVLITGAANGIGALVVRKILDEGVKHVAVLDVNQKLGSDLEKELNSKHGSNKVKFIYCDVTDEDKFVGSFKEVVDQQGGLDVVINNAGIMNDSLKAYKKMIDINVTALVTGTLKGIEYMSKENGGKGGAVINMSSIAALYQDAIVPIYYGTKSAVLQFSNCIGREEYYSRNGVRVLTICFGATDTGLLDLKNIGCFDPKIRELLPVVLGGFDFQRPESAAQGVVDMFKLGASGSTWLAVDDKPVKDITDNVKKAYDILSSEVFGTSSQ